MSRRSVLIDALAATPRDLARLLRPVSATMALRRPSADSWGVAEVVAHLSVNEVAYQARLRLIIEQDTPTVPFIHPTPSSHELQYPLPELCEQFSEHRTETLAFLRELKQHDWARRLVHETLGPSRFRDQVQMLVDHDSTHLEQIVTLRAWMDTLR